MGPLTWTSYSFPSEHDQVYVSVVTQALNLGPDRSCFWIQRGEALHQESPSRFNLYGRGSEKKIKKCNRFEFTVILYNVY